MDLQALVVSRLLSLWLLVRVRVGALEEEEEGGGGAGAPLSAAIISLGSPPAGAAW